MHDYTTIIGVIELRLHKISYDNIQKRYRIGRSGISLIMECISPGKQNCLRTMKRKFTVRRHSLI